MKDLRWGASMPPRREIVLERLEALKPGLVEEFGVQRLELFGSVALGEQTGPSDVDLLVEFDHVPTLFEMGRLKTRLEDELESEVDLVTPGGLRERTLAAARKSSIAV